MRKLMGRYEIDKRLQLVGTLYAQPRLDDPSDIRVLNETQLIISISKKVSFSTAFQANYDSAPPDQVEGLDTRVKGKFTYSF